MCWQEDEEKEEDYDEEDLVSKAEADFFDTIEHAVKLREKKEAEKKKAEEALMRSSNEGGGSGKVSLFQSYHNFSLMLYDTVFSK